jgi:translation elongation factor EF-1beta
MTRMLWRAAAALSLALTIVACGNSKKASTTATTTTGVPAGFTTFQDKSDHFKLSVPSSWRQVDASSPGAIQAAKDLAAANPTLQSLIGSGDLASKGIKYLAIAADGQSNVYVVVKATPGVKDSDLPNLVDTLKAQYQQAGATVESTSSVPLAGHQALQVKLTLPQNDGSGGTTNLHETQDIVAANDFAYIVTLTGTSPDLTAIGSSLNVS